MPAKFFYKKLEFNVNDSVYEPREDSVLLADAVKESDASGKIVLDMGCGTGLQGINALSMGAKKCVFADIDKNAVENAKENARINGFEKKSGFKRSDLFSSGALKEKKFGLIVFNPPYVESEEKKWLDTDGRKKGRETLDSFLKQARKRLEKGGKLFFVQSSLNGETKTRKLLKSLGFGGKAVARKRLFFEELIVFKCVVA